MTLWKPTLISCLHAKMFLEPDSAGAKALVLS